MTSLDLTSEQCGQMLWREDMHRQRLERVYQRMVDVGFPENDQLRVCVRDALLASRKLCLQWSEGLQKGEYRRYHRRSRDWPWLQR